MKANKIPNFAKWSNFLYASRGLLVRFCFLSPHCYLDAKAPMFPISLKKQKQLLFLFPCLILFPKAIPPPVPPARPTLTGVRRWFSVSASSAETPLGVFAGKGAIQHIQEHQNPVM